MGLEPSVLLSQWPNFKLFGVTYLVGKIKYKLLFQGPLAKLDVEGDDGCFYIIFKDAPVFYYSRSHYE